MLFGGRGSYVTLRRKREGKRSLVYIGMMISIRDGKSSGSREIASMRH